MGGIGCCGPTLTVRLFSRVPFERVTRIHADTDSHTSVALLRVLLAERYGLRPTLIDYHAREQVADHRLTPPPETMLLIGDKVVTDGPPAKEYPHQLDLGEAWHEMTGLPFVFAIWMARAGVALGDLPGVLESQRIQNSRRIEAIVDAHAAAHGWPRELAMEYLGRLLRYETGPAELRAIEHFASLAQKAGLIQKARPLALHRKLARRLFTFRSRSREPTAPRGLPMPQEKKIIGLIGGIGSGKSAVARVFASLGCGVIDADRVVAPGAR